MSGDVQPRKRKDKRKKKEGSSLGNIHEPLSGQKLRNKSITEDDSDCSPVLATADQGEKIHIQNDHGIGGNVCVKIVFFLLLAALVTAVGIIFIHSRGSTDVDLPTIEESRFANYFTGWLDDAMDEHEHDESEFLHNVDEEHEDHDEEGELQAEEHFGKSEEEVEREDASKYVFENGSPEIDENEEIGLEKDEMEDEHKKEIEEKVDEQDSEENGKSDENDEDIEIKEENTEDSIAPKFKVIHRFKHFYNMRKNFKKDEIKDFRKIKKLDKKEEMEEVEEEKENEDLQKTKDVKEKTEAEEVIIEEKRQETEEEDENIKEEKKEKKDEELEENIEDEENYNDIDNYEEDDADEEYQELKKEITNKLEKHKIDEEFENLKEELYDYSDESSLEDKERKLTEYYEEEEETEEKFDSDEDQNDGDKRSNLDDEEIDESEEALKEEIYLHRDESSYKDNSDIGKEDENYDLREEVFENKIIDIEEKLNEILREKRRSVEQRKIEMEEIEMQSHMEVKEIDKIIENEEESDSTGVAVKLIVGIALIIVAHLVLIRKWNSMGKDQIDEKSDEILDIKNEGYEEVEDIEPVVSRKQTLVPETSDLNEHFFNEIEEEEFEEEDEDEEEFEEEEEDEDENEEEEFGQEEKEIEISEDDKEYSEDEEIMSKDNSSWKYEYSDRIKTVSKDLDNEEYTEEEEEELEDEELEEGEEDEEIIEDEEEEDNIYWKRIETVKMKSEEEPPIPPPRKSHVKSSNEERKSDGPRGIEDFNEASDFFEDSESDPASDDPGEDIPLDLEEDKISENKFNDDWSYKQEFKFAEEQIDNNPKAALKAYDSIILKNSRVVRALIGRAKALDKIAEMERSNQYLKQAIDAYKDLLLNYEGELKDEQYLQVSQRCLDRMRFGGYLKSAIEIHKALIRKFPNNPKHRNDLAVTYLLLNEITLARSLLSDTLKIWPKNGFALVHYGFILKTSDNNYAEGVEKLMTGIKTREPGVVDGRFYFHLGDALNRLGRNKEAIKWYDDGVKEGLFLSRYQRSLYNVNRLKGQPWWTKKETTYQDFFNKLEDSWLEIRKEGLNLLNAKGINLFKPEAENLKDTGDWRQLDLFFRGRKHENCKSAPITCSLISSFHPASTCTRGQVKFSVMLPSTHVWPHCGPTNCRLRSHLGLVVPNKTFLRVAEETRSWKEGEVIIFDDSFEHEVWHNGTGIRLVLIVDVWHPELTVQERKYLSPI